MAQPPILNCNTTGYTGKNVLFDVAFACGDVADPKALSYMPVGGMKTKDLDMGQDTTDATTDRTVGFYREMVATYKTLSISGDGIASPQDGSRSNLSMLTKFWAANQQAAVWVRMTYPDITIYAYMIITNLSRPAPSDDLVTFSIELEVTGSDVGVIIEDTPGTAEAVESISLAPTTLALLIGTTDTGQLVPTILPAGANQAATYLSSDATIATVDASGLVTAVAVGEATITATAVGDGTKTAQCVVTVTA